MSQVPPVPPQKSAEPSAKAQCSITGIWVPADELVMFQGRLVSAEGKQIMLDRMMAGDPVDATVTRPSVLRRFGCIFLDNLIIMVPIMIVAMIGMVGTFNQIIKSDQMRSATQPVLYQQNYTYQGFSDLFTFVIALCYFALLHARNGKTFGKMAGHLQVLNMDGTPISARTAWIRSFVFVWSNLFTGLCLLFILPIVGSAIVLTITGLIGFGWIVADVVCALVDTRMQRSLHDRIAGTRVIWLNA